MARFPAGDARPGDLPGSVQQPIGFSVPRESFRKRRKDEGRREKEDDDDDDDDDAPPRSGSQKAAPLVVRVIDDRENMRARKKGPPLPVSLLRGILSRGCAHPTTVTRPVPVAAGSLPERFL